MRASRRAFFSSGVSTGFFGVLVFTASLALAASLFFAGSLFVAASSLFTGSLSLTASLPFLGRPLFLLFFAYSMKIAETLQVSICKGFGYFFFCILATTSM